MGFENFFKKNKQEETDVLEMEPEHEEKQEGAQPENSVVEKPEEKWKVSFAEIDEATKKIPASMSNMTVDEIIKLATGDASQSDITRGALAFKVLQNKFIKNYSEVSNKLDLNNAPVQKVLNAMHEQAMNGK